jgi:hypothetical protein
MARLLTSLSWRFVVRRPAELVDALSAHVATLTEAVIRS